MSTNVKNMMREVMVKAWSFVKNQGYTLSEALRVAWMNVKLRKAMKTQIVEFFYIKEKHR